jgi:hypothetical protein
MTYELHIVLNEKLLSDLKKHSRRLNSKSVSSAIVEIFEKYLPYLEKTQIEFQNRKSSYKLIADLKEKRKHVHVYFPEKYYRKLKELHQYINFYSIAQIIREIIELYLKECFKNGIELTLKKIELIKKNWEKRKLMRKGKEYIRQLSQASPQIPMQTITYDSHYHPYSIKFL